MAEVLTQAWRAIWINVDRGITSFAFEDKFTKTGLSESAGGRWAGFFIGFNTYPGGDAPILCDIRCVLKNAR